MSNHSFTFDGIDLGVFATYGLTVVRPYDTEALPQMRVDERDLAQADGAATQGSSYRAGRFSIHYAIRSTSWGNTTTKIRNVAGVLDRSQTGEKSLVFDAEVDRIWTARMVGSFRPERHTTGATGVIEFLVNPPFSAAVGATADEDEVTGQTDIVIANGGDTETDVVWIIKNDATESASLTLNNLTRGEVVTWAHVLGADEWLKIDTSDWSVQVTSNDGGDYTNSATGVTGTPPRLDPGNNTLRVQGLVTGDLAWSFFAKNK